MLPYYVGHGSMALYAGEKMDCDGSTHTSVVDKDRKCRDNSGSLSGQKSPNHACGETNISLNLQDQRSVDHMLMCHHRLHTDSTPVCNQYHSKNRQDEIVSGLGTRPRFDQGNSLTSIDWRPLKWARSESFCSRSSGIQLDSPEAMRTAELRSVTLVSSSSADSLLVASNFTAQDSSLRKKQRLGWGEGLAKYEKGKAKVSDGSADKTDESGYPALSNSSERSPQINGLNRFASPATPSFSSNYSQDTNGKSFMKVVGTVCDSTELELPSTLNRLGHFFLDLEELDPDALCSMLIDLQKNDEDLPNPSSVRSEAIGNLLIWKSDISKALESTETEIDQLENELRLLNVVSSDGSLPVDNYEDAQPQISSLGTVSQNDPTVLGVQVHATDDCCGRISTKPNISVQCSALNTEVSNILKDNEDVARESSAVFDKLLFCNQRATVATEDLSFSSQHSWHSIQERIAKRKRFIKTKQKLLALKLRAVTHHWIENLDMFSVRKDQVKFHKTHVMNLRASNSVLQSSNRSSRFVSPGKNLNELLIGDVGNDAGLEDIDMKVKPYRDKLKMPDMVVDKKERMVSRFMSSNGLVEDPCSLEKERTLINLWTSEEKNVFIQKLSEFGKDFKKISSFLELKTTADCIEFYYKNHKSDCFAKVKKPVRQSQDKSQLLNAYLVPSGKKWIRDHMSVSPSCINTETNEEAVAADVLAGIYTSTLYEPISSRVTSSVGGRDCCRGCKFQCSGSEKKLPLAESSSDADGGGIAESCDWTDQERCLLIQAVSSYGKDFTMVSRYVGTRSPEQCKVFFSKARRCLGLEKIACTKKNENESKHEHMNRCSSLRPENNPLVELECSFNTSSVANDPHLRLVLSDEKCNSDSGLDCHLRNHDKSDMKPFGGSGGAHVTQQSKPRNRTLTLKLSGRSKRNGHQILTEDSAIIIGKCRNNVDLCSEKCEREQDEAGTKENAADALQCLRIPGR